MSTAAVEIKDKPGRFKDLHGKEWRLDITLGLRNKVKEETGVDFFDTMSKESCIAKVADPDTLGAVLWLMLEDQAKAANILDPAELFGRLDSDALEQAIDGLVDAVVFFSRRSIRPAVRLAVERAREVEKQVAETIVANLDKISSQIDSALLGSSSSATRSPPSPESKTRSRGRSEGSRGKRKQSSVTSGRGRRR